MNEKQDRIWSTSAYYKDNQILQNMHPIVYLFEVFIIVMSIIGLMKFGSWQWVVAPVAAVVAIYANFRTRRVTTSGEALAWVAIVFAGLALSIGGILWALHHK